MGLLGKIFGDADLGCAVGVAISPFGALASGECDASIEKVADKAEEIVRGTSGVATSYRNDTLLPENTKNLIEASLVPLPFYVLGRFAGQQLIKSLGLSPETSADLQHQLSWIENLFLTIAPLLFPGPLLPVAVGLERYVRTHVSPITAEDVGSFAAGLFTSAAMIGIGGIGTRALSAGVKKAKAAVGEETLNTYLEKIGGPSALLFVNPLL